MSGDRPVLDDAVELLERSLGYTRTALLTVTDAALTRPTPCAAWDLDQLLDHMDDALGAFAEAARGGVDPLPPHLPRRPTARVRTRSLQQQACTLLALWSRPVPDSVAVGDQAMLTTSLVRAAALEITVHGWDVADATGSHLPIPETLARDLIDVARSLVATDDRGVRFGAPAPAGDDPRAETRLLAFLGRSRTRPPGLDRGVPGTDPQAAS